MSTEELIQKSKDIFNNPHWDYSETIYQGPSTKIKIYCKCKDELGNDHGWFEQDPYSHLAGHGCSKCSHRSRAYDTNEWITKARRVNNNLYDFKLDKYENQQQIIECICPKHGSFFRMAKRVLHGVICPQCDSEEKMKKKQNKIIDKCKEIHGDKYNYDEFVYKGMNEKSIIICPKHGPFETRPSNHINNRSGCPICANEANGDRCRYDKETFIEKARKVHGDKYDYSKVEYINNSTLVCIICPVHGEFWQTPHGHLAHQGCYSCRNHNIRLKQLLPLQEWIDRCKKTHGDKYTYEFPEEVDYYTKVKITCPIHGDFYQQISNHANGQGCPKCKQSHLERTIEMSLNENNILFEYECRFTWLGTQSLDFYLPQSNIAIECQGSQHFEKDKFFKDLSIILERDERKRQLCVENGVQLVYFLDKKYNKYVENLNIPYFNDTETLLEFIKQAG